MDRNQFLFLLGGLKWTLALSAIGFAVGAIAGLGVALARTSGHRMLERCAGRLHRAVPGHAAADAVVCRLLRPCAGRPETRLLGLRLDRLHPARQRLSRRDLARLDRGRAARPGRSRQGAQPRYISTG